MALWRDGDADGGTDGASSSSSSSSFASYGTAGGAGAGAGAAGAEGAYQPLRADGTAFDWNSSFMMRLELLPETHVTARVASKIMFSGKAVKLLQTAKFSGDAFFRKPQLREIYAYLARGASPSSVAAAAAQGQGQAGSGGGSAAAPNDVFGTGENESKDGSPAPSLGRFAPPTAGGDPSAAFAAATAADFDDYFEKCGFRREEVKRFTAKFHQVRALLSPVYPFI